MDFINDTICKVHQIYKCDLLPKELKELRYTCRYEIKKMRFKKYINSLAKEKILKRDNFRFVKVLFLYPKEKLDSLFPLKYSSKCKMPQAYSKCFKKQDFYKVYYFIKPYTTHLMNKKGIDFNDAYFLRDKDSI